MYWKVSDETPILDSYDGLPAADKGKTIVSPIVRWSLEFESDHLYPTSIGVLTRHLESQMAMGHGNCEVAAGQKSVQQKWFQPS